MIGLPKPKTDGKAYDSTNSKLYKLTCKDYRTSCYILSHTWVGALFPLCKLLLSFAVSSKVTPLTVLVLKQLFLKEAISKRCTSRYCNEN